MRAFRPLIVVVIQTTSPRGGDDQPASLSHSTGRHLHHIYAHEHYPPVAFCLQSTFRATPTRKTCDFAMRNPVPLISKGPTRYHNPGTPPMLMISCPSTPIFAPPKTTDRRERRTHGFASKSGSARSWILDGFEKPMS